MNKGKHFGLLRLCSALLILCLLLLTGCGKTESGSGAEENSTADISASSFGSTAALQGSSEAGAGETASEAPATAIAEEDGAEAASTAEGVPLVPTAAPVLYDAMALPASVDEGRILVNTLFQSSMPNPDCGNATGENVATLELVNQSGMFIDSAAFVVTLTDGTVLNFAVEAIPADTTVWAFELANSAVDTQAAVAEISCTAYYADGPQLMEETLAVACNMTIATITNTGEESLSDLNVEFHCLFEGVYFGGLTIKYHIDEIPAGTTSDLDVAEAYLGEAVAVRVTAGGY